MRAPMAGVCPNRDAIPENVQETNLGGEPKMALQAITFNEIQLATAVKQKVCKQQLSVARVNEAIAQCSHIINPAYKAWYAKAVYALGVDYFLQLAGMAKHGNQPQKLFSRLLREALQ